MKRPQPASPEPDVSMSELAQLPPRGSVAIAVRCANRLAPFFRLPDDFEDREACQSIYDAALARATNYARGGADDGERLRELTEAAYQMAELTAEITEYASYAVAHAVQAVGFAREVDGDAAAQKLMQLVASTFGACRVLIQRGRSLGTEAGVAAIRGDLEALKDIPVAAGVDPSATGPLGDYWPEGKPLGF
ncbi:MAG: hypothetical protein WCL32_07925 [Planctomycetota bacterium]|jgi:hypothetical protein